MIVSNCVERIYFTTRAPEVDESLGLLNLHGSTVMSIALIDTMAEASVKVDDIRWKKPKAVNREHAGAILLGPAIV